MMHNFKNQKLKMDIFLYLAKVSQNEKRTELHNCDLKKPNLDFELDFDELENRNDEESQDISEEDALPIGKEKTIKRSSISQTNTFKSESVTMTKSEEIFAIALDVC